MDKNAKAVRGRGRPRVGDFRLECTIPKAAYLELVRRGRQAGGVYHTRVAADILTTELIGGVTRRDG